MKIHDNCNWTVCYDVETENGKERVVSACFNYLNLAEDFLMKVIPEETRKRFYIVHRDHIDE